MSHTFGIDLHNNMSCYISIQNISVATDEEMYTKQLMCTIKCFVANYKTFRTLRVAYLICDNLIIVCECSLLLTAIVKKESRTKVCSKIRVSEVNSIPISRNS